MFDYNICKEANDDVFKRQCLALEQNIVGLIKQQELEDVDGSDYQTYKLGTLSLTVYNDKSVGAIYIKSDFDISHYFSKK